MTDQPITPTRIIPGPVHLPDRPPADGELPPWWEQPAPAAPQADAPPPPAAPQPPPEEAPQQPGVLEVRIVHETADQPEQEADPPSRWSLAWVRAHLHPWWTLIGAVLALTPIPWTGYSAATTWAYTVSQAREFGVGWAYATAVGAFALAALADHRGRYWRPLTRFTVVVTFIGFFGAAHWYDPVTFLTGVQP